MKRNNVLAGVALTFAVAAAPVAAHAAGKISTQFVGPIKSKGSTATLRVRYQCESGASSSVVVLQNKAGTKDSRLATSAGSRAAVTLLQSNRNNFKCNSGPNTTMFTVDRKEKGSKGSLRSGYAYVRFSIMNGKTLKVSKNGWVKVVK